MKSLQSIGVIKGAIFLRGFFMKRFWSRGLLIGMFCCAVTMASGIDVLVVIKDVFLNTPYEMRLYDIHPYIYRYLRNGYKVQKLQEGDAHVLSIGVNTRKGYPVFYGCLDQKFLKIIDQAIPYEEKRAQKTLDIRDTYAKNGHIVPNNYQVELREQRETIVDYDRMLKHERNLGVVPCIVYADTGSMPDERCNLFDMFSADVDTWVSHYGVREVICHSAKTLQTAMEDQVSVFVVITADVDGTHYEVPGLCQYTFNAEHICYHRAFKPLTKECLAALSNGITQCVMRRALYDLLSDLVDQGELTFDCKGLFNNTTYCDKKIAYKYISK